MEQTLAYPFGAPLISGVFKSRFSDFLVDEDLGFEPGGDGEHLFLRVEKNGLGTQELIARIARDYAINPALIGYSGLKDKNAITRQWLSLHLPGQKPPIDLPVGEGYRVLQQARHHKKLRPGSHKSNTFELRLREIENLPDQTREQIACVVGQGFANYFGVQRFGRKQDNVEQALAQLGNRRLKRARKGLLISSLRSYLFNQVLAQRVRLGHWQEPLQGDVFMLRGSHSIFSDPVDENLVSRFHQLDISSTASLYGSGRQLMSGEASEIESQVFAQREDITACLDQQGAKLQMRPLRVAVDDFSYDYDASDRSLLLRLTLPPGSYVTSMLDHFIKLRDAS
jgi:tRNA pseudouridine13 synthase